LRGTLGRSAGQARQIGWVDDAVDALGVNGSGLGGVAHVPPSDRRQQMTATLYILDETQPDTGLRVKHALVKPTNGQTR
jgi:hypothetical protein